MSIVVKLGLFECVVAAILIGLTLGLRFIRDGGCTGPTLAVATTASLTPVPFAINLVSVISLARWVVVLNLKVLEVDVTAAVAGAMFPLSDACLLLNTVSPR